MQRNGSYALITTQQEALFSYYRQGGSAEQLDNMLFYYMAVTKAPARLADISRQVGTLARDMVTAARRSRAVRRAPQVARGEGLPRPSRPRQRKGLT